MSFTALQAVTITGPDGALTTIQPGETIDDFATWPYPTQQAMLRLGRVRKEYDKFGGLEVSGGRLHFMPSEMMAVLERGRAELAAKAEAEEPAGDVSCDHCERTFGTEAGKNRHARSAHKDLA